MEYSDIVAELCNIIFEIERPKDEESRSGYDKLIDLVEVLEAEIAGSQ